MELLRALYGETEGYSDICMAQKRLRVPLEMPWVKPVMFVVLCHEIIYSDKSPDGFSQMVYTNLH